MDDGCNGVEQICSHPRLGNGSERFGVRVPIQKLGRRCFGQFDSYTFFVKADAELLASIVRWEAKHLAGLNLIVTKKQLVENGFVFSVKSRHNMPCQA